MLIVTFAVTEPMGFVAVRMYVVVDAGALKLNEPEVFGVTDPIPLSMLRLLAPSTFQFNVTCAPATTVLSVAANELITGT